MLVNPQSRRLARAAIGATLAAAALLAVPATGSARVVSTTALAAGGLEAITVAVTVQPQDQEGTITCDVLATDITDGTNTAVGVVTFSDPPAMTTAVIVIEDVAAGEYAVMVACGDESGQPDALGASPVNATVTAAPSSPLDQLIELFSQFS